jgi:uncharacterized protein (TIGR03437 family)
VAVLFAGAARGQAPSYSAAGIVNASDYAPGPFAPNSALSLFGTNLSLQSPQVVTSALMAGNFFPTQVAGVSVFMDNVLSPLLYVSAGQINFLVPATEIAGPAQVTVVRQGVYGPSVTIDLVAAAPQFFTYTTVYPGYLIAQDWNNGYGVITPDAPAHAGDIVILYATGLGAVTPATASGELAPYASPIVEASWASLQVTIDGAALAPSAVLYAGLSPGSAGLYQINLVLPAEPGTDPLVQVSISGQASAAGCQLAVR